MKNEAGFTLLEVLVAFVILAGSIVIVLQTSASQVETLSRLDLRQAAVVHAESHVARIGVDTELTGGETDGTYDEVFRWQLRISPHKTDTPPQEGAPAPYEIDLTVAWTERGQSRSYTLSTLKLAWNSP